MKTTNIKTVVTKAGKFISMCLIAGAISFSFASCEEEDASTSGGCEDALMNLVSIVEAKSSAFASNPTPANCSALRTATLNMIYKAEACGQTGIHAEQKAYWQSIDCSEFGD